VTPGEDELTLVLYPKAAILDGRHAHNPWLQELPDPVTKVVWDNYASLAAATAERLRVSEGDVVRLQVRGEDLPALELPVHVQPGQSEQVVAVALGYGRKGTDRFFDLGPDWLQAEATVERGATVGVNAAGLLKRKQHCLGYDTHLVQLTRTSRQSPLACTQDHHSLTVPPHLAPKGGEVRDAVRWTSAQELAAGFVAAGPHDHPAEQLWPDDHRYTGHHWGLAIDLNACTGCSACVIGCQAENNVPVVGKDEVRRHREMHWIRIDRYYQGEEDDVTAFHQPMMCQHCDHAPCENVCPVLATVHSSEGLNQQVYNRCVGTRYCANNCPYKVRRFNWFDYPREDRLQNMVLNPDVTIRSRGVMEKCSLCVQRIQEEKIAARQRGEPVADGAIQPACQQSCPTSAMVFGDFNDPDSKVNKLRRQSRAYTVLGELNVRPSVHYLAAMRNRKGQGGEPH
jgi:molybdopterin-containing oxidoreductase family iron-sulfur binding subunit